MEALEQRASAGAAITPSDLRNDDSNLYSAILRHFGTLELASRAANVGGKITSSLGQLADECWGFSKEGSESAFKSVATLGVEQLTAGRVLRKASGLIMQPVVTWEVGTKLASLGFEVEAIRKAGSSTRLRWTEDKLLEAIRAPA